MLTDPKLDALAEIYWKLKPFLRYRTLDDRVVWDPNSILRSPTFEEFVADQEKRELEKIWLTLTIRAFLLPQR